MLMMNFFSSWAEQIIMAVVIGSIIEMVLPDNKNKKYVKMVIGIYILFTIISPFVNKNDLLSFENLNLESYAVSSENSQKTELNQNSMDERLTQLYIEELENNIKEKVKEKGYKVQSCKVDAILTGDENKKGINKIRIDISKEKEEVQNSSHDSNIKSVNKVEVKVGLDKFFEDDEADYNSNEMDSNFQTLKEELSKFYEVDISKIIIQIK